LPVLLSEPVAWEAEYRCFVLGRRVVASSAYLRGGQPARDEDGCWVSPPEEQADADAFASRLLADPAVGVPPAFVLDVGRVEGRGWAVVEANPAFGSGLYGCDAG